MKIYANLTIFLGLLVAVGSLAFSDISRIGNAGRIPNLRMTPTPPIKVLTPVPQKTPCKMPVKSSDAAVQPKSDSTPVYRNAEQDVIALAEVAKTTDFDCDGVNDYDDNCKIVANPDQRDSNKNGIGDACDRRRTKRKRPTHSL